MTRADDNAGESDPFDLNRFLAAQEDCYDDVLAELNAGQKRTHWMWFIFPQLDGLAFSAMSKRYAIRSLEEAQAYLDHPILGPRLLQCAQAVVDVEERSAAEIFGSPDDLKLKSCATLFAAMSPPDSVFERILAKYYDNVPDDRTLQLVEKLKKQAAD